MKTRNITDFVGNTPLVEAQHILQKQGVTLLLKLEGNNPGGSVKDRAAYHMISEAIRRKNIRKGDTLVEATSGNTGIALALMARVLGSTYGIGFTRKLNRGKN
jgi:cysteine synthase B